MSATIDTNRALGDLAMQTIDHITERYGADCELVAACLVVEIKTCDENGDDYWDAHYEVLPDVGPIHTFGLLDSAAKHINPA